MSDSNADIRKWEAIAREHGCGLAFLWSELVDESGESQFEAMLLVIREENKVLAFHLHDFDGAERVYFLITESELERARQGGNGD